MDCVFCGIVAGSLPSWPVRSDPSTVAFLDVNPATPGHTLVVPRRHAEDLYTVDADDLAACVRTAHQVALDLRDRLGAAGMNLFVACRPAGWQTVYHLHVHVIPRYPDDGLVQPWRVTPGDPAALAEIADRLGGQSTGMR